MDNKIQQPCFYSHANSEWNNSDTISTWHNWIASKTPHSIRCLFISTPINDSYVENPKFLEDREVKPLTCQNTLTESKNKLLKSLQDYIEINFKHSKEILESTETNEGLGYLKKNKKYTDFSIKLLNLIANNYPELIDKTAEIILKQQGILEKNTSIYFDLNYLLRDSLIENIQKKESDRSCNLWNYFKKSEPAQYGFTKKPEEKKCFLDFLESNGFSGGNCNLLGNIWIINHSKKNTLQKDITLESTGVKDIILESKSEEHTNHTQHDLSYSLLRKRSFEPVSFNDREDSVGKSMSTLCGDSKTEDDIEQLSKRITETGEHECLYKRIALIGSSNHLVTACVNTTSGVDFYDPDIGEFRFPNKKEFHTWFCTEYWHKSASVFERANSHRVSNFKLS